MDKKGGGLKMWDYVQCCVIGNKPHHPTCQDSCYHYSKNGIECIVVCDGASSGVKSELGARFISEFAADYFIEHFEHFWNGTIAEINTCLFDMHQLALVNLSEYVQNEGNPSIISIEDKNRVLPEELDKYCTTIQLIAIKDNSLLTYKVGNGAMACIIQNSIYLMSPSCHTGYTSHFTYKRTIDTLMNSVLCKYSITQPITGLYIMSDGVDFEDGLFFNGSLTSNNIDMVNLLLSNHDNQNEILREYIDNLATKETNTSLDDISIALLLNQSDAIKVESISDNILPNYLESIPLLQNNNKENSSFNSKRFRIRNKKCTSLDNKQRVSEGHQKELQNLRKQKDEYDSKIMTLEESVFCLERKIKFFKWLLISAGSIIALIFIMVILQIIGVM